MSSPPIIALSIGDLAGIGPEVLIKALGNSEITNNMTPVVYATQQFLKSRAAELNLPLFEFRVAKSTDDILPGMINVIEAWTEEVSVILGNPSNDSGACALKSLEQAGLDLKEGRVDALVTAPIDKRNMQKAGFGFPGHTEYLADLSSSQDFLMLLVSGGLRVGVLTGHIPISQVATQLSRELIMKRLVVMHESLLHDFGISDPRIAVLGLNPHAGDQGVIGREEIEVIVPAISEARAAGINAFGPFPADGFFGSDQRGQYDAILAMYHDQGLVPFKALSFGKGVNFTAGLPTIRTSPDHGTAYGIADQRVADATSFEEALIMAVSIVEKRSSIATKA